MADEYKFIVLDVKNNFTEAEIEAVKNACPYSFARFLYELDISDFDPNKVPDLQNRVAGGFVPFLSYKKPTNKKKRSKK